MKEKIKEICEIIDSVEDQENFLYFLLECSQHLDTSVPAQEIFQAALPKDLT